MVEVSPQLQALIDGARADAKGRYARWDDSAFDHCVSWQAKHLWQVLQAQPAKVRERSLRAYLGLVVAGIGAGYLGVNRGPPRTLMEAFLVSRVPLWLGKAPPARHAEIATAAWNLADGVRRQAVWMEQYLLARVNEFADPLALEQKALELLKPVLEPRASAAWRGPFTVTVVDIAPKARSFLPGEVSMVTPSLLRVGDRRHRHGVGVLLLPGGKSNCIGRMDGIPPVAAPVPAPDVAVTWASDRVTVAGNVVDLALMACEPLHTLALPGGYLVAVVQNSQRLWVVETP